VHTKKAPNAWNVFTKDIFSQIPKSVKTSRGSQNVWHSVITGVGKAAYQHLRGREVNTNSADYKQLVRDTADRV
jgi:3-methyladenine DNA glycosylase AlkD